MKRGNLTQMNVPEWDIGMPLKNMRGKKEVDRVQMPYRVSGTYAVVLCGVFL